MAESTAEKKHLPSARRLRDEREKGHVAVSRDFSAAAGLLAGTGVFISLGTLLMQRMTHAIATSVGRLGDASRHDINVEELTQIVIQGGKFLAVTVGPIALAAGTGVFLSGLQTNFNFAPKALTIDFNKLNPANGLKKLTPLRTGLDTIKTIITSIVLVVLAWPIVRNLIVDSQRLAWTATVNSVHQGWDHALTLLWRAGFALLTLGGLDVGVQKWRYTSQLKMTDQEAKDEAKNSEFSPEIKARIRKIRRDLFRSRMMKAVPTATVVLTNPTHFAVALQYKREKSPAPIVVAKGKDLVAAKIREIARQHSVPIIENPALTRQLFKECEIGDTIPGPLFGAVAEILAYLIRIKQLVL